MASTNVFPQLGDIGDSFDSFSRPTVRDSINYYIYEGESPLFYIPMEGGALDLIGQSVESISFSIYNDGKKIALKEGMIFEGQNENQIISTFLFSLDGDEKKIHYKIISYNSIDIENIILFKKDSENINHLARPMIPQSGTVPKPVVISREDWGADPPDGQYSNHPYYDKLTLHHAACCSAENIEEGLEQVKWIQYFHQNGRGWMDIGYHFLVDRAGNIYQGRPETVLGAHVGGANTGNIGVCLLGCYHPPEDNCYQTMTDESRDALVKLYGWISDTYGQDPGALLGHRDYFGTTACPGNNVWNEITYYYSR